MTSQMAVSANCPSLYSLPCLLLTPLFYSILPVQVSPPFLHNCVFYFPYLGVSSFCLVPYSVPNFCASMSFHKPIKDLKGSTCKQIYTIFVFMDLGYLTQDDSFLAPSIYL